LSKAPIREKWLYIYVCPPFGGQDPTLILNFSLPVLCPLLVRWSSRVELTWQLTTRIRKRTASHSSGYRGCRGSFKGLRSCCTTATSYQATTYACTAILQLLDQPVVGNLATRVEARVQTKRPRCEETLCRSEALLWGSTLAPCAAATASGR
jgi:hypothetical protein